MPGALRTPSTGADLLLDDLRRVLDRLEKQTAPARDAEAASFAHGTR
jgi:glutamate decarboxylase